MSYPASTMTEKWYRNDIKEVRAFFTARHPDHYHIYNMSNRPYDPSKLDHHVSDDFVWHDHHSPALTVLFLACKRMFEFVLQDPQKNTVAVHCNAGKGRTGSTIACYLMYTGLIDNYIDALTYYGRKRFSNGRGVT
jgi:protein-tyrosine phosphatase